MTLLNLDHAHPTMVAGHPFKGPGFMSIGQLQHPDLKRFGIDDSTLFAPPRPNAWANAFAFGTFGMAAVQAPSFGDFFATYFAGRSFNIASDNKCSTMLEGMKKCYENHSEKDPINSCNYYISGFERMACGKN